jgi:hypothetical protein
MCIFLILMSFILNRMLKLLIFVFALFLCLKVAAQSDEFSPGYYYDGNDQKNIGLIQIDPTADYLKFKKDSAGKSEKIKIENIKSVIMITGFPRGNDSLAVLQDGNSKSNKYFGKLIVVTPNTALYNKFMDLRFGGAPNMSVYNVPNSRNNTGSHAIIRWSMSRVYTYSRKLIMYQDGNTTRELTKKNYIEVLSKAFSDQPYLVQDIVNKRYKFDQVNDPIERYWRQKEYSHH